MTQTTDILTNRTTQFKMLCFDGHGKFDHPPQRALRILKKRRYISVGESIFFDEKYVFTVKIQK